MRRDLLRRGAALILLAASGCVVVVDDVSTTLTSETSETSGDGDGEPTSESDATTDSGDGDGEAGDGDGDPATAGDGDGDPDPTDTSETTGDGDCDPLEDILQLNYELSGVDEIFNEQIEWQCTLTSLDQQDGFTLELDCPEAEQPVVLSISSQPEVPPLGLEPGTQIELKMVYEGPFWVNLHLRLDVAAGEHLLTLIYAESLLPVEPYSFELPWITNVSEDHCSSTQDPCGLSERLALDFAIDGQDYRVFDTNHAVIGPGHDVWVREASRWLEVECTDLPQDWFRVLMVNDAP